MMTIMQKRPIIIFLTMVFATLFVTQVRAEECFWLTGVCFGTNWRTATPADVADVNINARTESGRTPLYWAAKSSETPAVIQALLTAGAEVNTRDKDGYTPLHLAARFSETPAVIITLLNHGANPKLKNNDGEIAFDLAQQNDQIKNTEAYWALNEALYNNP